MTPTHLRTCRNRLRQADLSLFSLSPSLVELTDLGPLRFQCLVDPAGTIRANAPPLIPRGLSGRTKFSPKDDIPDLDGQSYPRHWHSVAKPHVP